MGEIEGAGGAVDNTESEHKSVISKLHNLVLTYTHQQQFGLTCHF